MQRHRLVFAALAEQLASGLHVLQVKTKVPAETKGRRKPAAHLLSIRNCTLTYTHSQRKLLYLSFCMTIYLTVKVPLTLTPPRSVSALSGTVHLCICYGGIRRGKMSEGHRCVASEFGAIVRAARGTVVGRRC